MFHRIRVHAIPVGDVVPIEPSYSKLVSSQTVENGKIVRESRYEIFNNADQLKGQLASDYSIVNLVALNAQGSLNTVYTVNAMSDFTLIDNFEKSYSAFQTAQAEFEKSQKNTEKK